MSFSGGNSSNPQHLNQCLTCQRIRKKGCPGYSIHGEVAYPCEECRRHYIECVPAPPRGRPEWFNDRAKLAEVRRVIRDWIGTRYQRASDDVLFLSPILAAPSSPSHQYDEVPSDHTIEHFDLSSVLYGLNLGDISNGSGTVTDLRFLLPLLEFIIARNLPQVRGLIFIVDRDDGGIGPSVESLIDHYRQENGDRLDFRIVGSGSCIN